MNYEDFPVDYLWECFNVDFLTGKLTWKQRPRYHFETDMAFATINSRQSGKAINRVDANGYHIVGLRGFGKSRKNLYQHRVLFAMYHGVWPDEAIDHHDGNTSNNSISNLRPVSQSVNSKNQRLRNTNKSGLHGVRWYDRYSAWHSEGTYNKRKFHLGYHKDFFEAICARKSWELDKEFTRRHGT